MSFKILKINLLNPLLQTTVWLDYWSNEGVSCVLLANSIDRLIIVSNSIYYFNKQRIIVKGLIGAVIATATINTGSLLAREFILPDRYIDRSCL